MTGSAWHNHTPNPSDVATFLNARGIVAIYSSHDELGLEPGLFERDQQTLQAVADFLQPPEEEVDRFRHYTIIGNAVDFGTKKDLEPTHTYVQAEVEQRVQTIDSLLSGATVSPDELASLNLMIQRLAMVFIRQPSAAPHIGEADKKDLLDQLLTERSHIDDIDRRQLVLVGQRLSLETGILSEEERLQRQLLAEEANLPKAMADQVLDFLDWTTEFDNDRIYVVNDVKKPGLQADIDEEILRLYGARLRAAQKIGTIKPSLGITLTDGARERDMLAMRLQWASTAGVPDEVQAELMRISILHSKQAQAQNSATLQQINRV